MGPFPSQGVLTGACSEWSSPSKTIIASKEQIFNQQTVEIEHLGWLCAALLSLESGFPLKRSYCLLVKHTINSPQVINTSCYSQGPLSTFRQTGWERKCQKLMKNRPGNGAVFVKRGRYLLRTVPVLHVRGLCCISLSSTLLPGRGLWSDLESWDHSLNLISEDVTPWNSAPSHKKHFSMNI